MALVGCSPSSGRLEQEPVTAVSFLPNGCENPVAFGASLDDRPDLRERAVALIDSQVSGRLPGVRFYVVHRGTIVPSRGIRTLGYRTLGPRSMIAVAWLDERDGSAAFELPGLAFEVEHLVSGKLEPFER